MHPVGECEMQHNRLIAHGMPPESDFSNAQDAGRRGDMQRSFLMRLAVIIAGKAIDRGRKLIRDEQSVTDCQNMSWPASAAGETALP